MERIFYYFSQIQIVKSRGKRDLFFRTLGAIKRRKKRESSQSLHSVSKNQVDKRETDSN